MATLAVPSDYPTITDAVQAAQPGDTIFLAAGYVNETALVTVEGITVEGDATNTGISLNLDPAIVQIRLAGSAPINVTGSDADNRIFGNSGDTALDGGDGNDTIDPGNGNDTVDGGAGTDRLQVNHAGASTAVSGGVSAGTLADGYTGSLSDSAGNSVAFSGIENFAITTGSGNDVIITGDGSDGITTGSGSDTIDAGGGNDSLSPGLGTDIVDGGTGRDTLLVNYSSASTPVTGGVSAGSLATGYSGSLSDSAGNSITFDGIEDFFITTGSGNDVVVTGDGRDNIRTGAGDDEIRTGGGFDIVDGGLGSDRLTVDYSSATTAVNSGSLSGSLAAGYNGFITDSAGNSIGFNGVEIFSIITGSGNDRITTGDGDDTISTAAGNDVVNAGGGDDAISTGTGNDNVNAGGGDDTINVGNGHDSVDGGLGTDRVILDYSDSTTNVTGGVSGTLAAGYSGSFSDSANNSVNFSGIESFSITTGSGNDFIMTGDGDDTINIGNGHDNVNGRLGTDRLMLDYSDSSTNVTGGLIGSLALGYQGSFSDSVANSINFSGIESFSITTGGGDDTITTGDGDDNISTGSGADTISAAHGSDNVDGGTGTDRVVVNYSNSTTDVTSGPLSGSLPVGYSGSLSDSAGNSTTFTGIENFSITSGSGNDVLFAGDGNDNVNSAGGDDTINVGRGVDTVNGGIGSDRLSIDYSGATTAVISGPLSGSLAAGYSGLLSDAAGDSVSFSGVETFSITTGSGSDRVTTGDGNDTINTGHGGRDDVTGGLGNDELVVDYSGFSTDVSLNGVSGSVVAGYAGLLFESPFNSVTFRAIENFTITTGSGNDHITTGDGDDTITTGLGDDTITAAAGNNVISAGAGNDRVTTGDGDDTITTDIGDDTITAGAGNNVISAGAGNDHVTTGGGDDTINLGGGIDQVTAGLGTDRLIVDHSSATTRVSGGISTGSLAAGYNGFLVGPAGNSIAFNGVENFSITTGSASDDVRTGDGDDAISTGAGNDFITIGRGHDSVDGGAGRDRLTIDYTASSSDVSSGTLAGSLGTGHSGSFSDAAGNSVAFSGIEDLTIRTGSGNDAIVTGDGSDIITTGDGDDTISAGGGFDVISAGRGIDAVDGGAGRDRLTIDYSSSTADVSSGAFSGSVAAGYSGSFADSSGNSITFVGIEDLSITSGSGNDVIVTGDGFDSVTSGEGDDLVSAGGGSDTLSGGAGTDTAVFGGLRSDYSITENEDGSFQVLDLRSGSPDGSDKLTDFEFARFSDITVALGNHAPVANDDSYATNEDAAINAAASAGVLANDSDADADTLSAVLVSGPAHGTLAFNADGSFIYTPEADYSGSDNFTYRANDGQEDSDVATAHITVNPVNDAPVAHDDAYTTDEDTALTVPAAGVLGNDSDIDSASLSSVLVSGPAHGTLALNADGSFTYTPETNYNGSDSFTYKANDGQDDSGVATSHITVNPVNDTPVAHADSAIVTEDTSILVAVLGNDTDVDSDALSIASLSGPKSALGASISIESGQVRYSADADSFDLLGTDATVADSFTYTVSDGHGGFSTATVNLTVTGDQANATVNLGNGDDIFVDVPGGRDTTVYGGKGADTIFGGDGADMLYGENGADTLNGGNGTDLLFGGQGSDRLTGGAGSDTFVFQKSGENDTVTDFQFGLDHVRLDDGLTVSSVTAIDVDHTGGLDAVLQLSNGSVTLLNTGAIADWHVLL